jgi:hypothetical protein
VKRPGEGGPWSRVDGGSGSNETFVIGEGNIIWDLECEGQVVGRPFCRGEESTVLGCREGEQGIEWGQLGVERLGKTKQGGAGPSNKGIVG